MSQSQKGKQSKLDEFFPKRPQCEPSVPVPIDPNIVNVETIQQEIPDPQISVDLMKEGATVILRNAKIDMFKGSMRLAVDKWGRGEVTDPATFSVNEDSNQSPIEFELVNVVEE